MEFDGIGNKKAWKHVRETLSKGEYNRRLTGAKITGPDDTIDDIGSDHPTTSLVSGKRYARDQKIRDAVFERAKGKCEYCGKAGFICSNGKAYLESHHIIALSSQGPDRLTNVIALCADHHREAHYGKTSSAIEKKMIFIVKSLTGAGKKRTS